MKPELSGYVKAAMKFDHKADKEMKTDNFRFEYRIGVVNQINPKYVLENLRSYETCDFNELAWGF